MAEETNSTVERVDVRLSVSYFVPLRPFERLLLSDLTVLLDQHHYPKFDPQNAPISSVFHEWSWAGLVKRCLNDDLGEELLHEEYRDDRNVAYKSFIHFLAHREGEQQNLARAEDLQSTNEDFLLKLGDRPVKDVEFKPVKEDFQLWETLSRLYQAYGRYWKFKELFGNSEGEFDIWKLIRKFTLHWQWPQNKENVYQVLVMSPSFEALFEVNRHDSVLNELEFSQTQDTIGEFEQLDIKQRPKTLLKWPAGEPMVDDDGSITDTYLKFLIRGLGQSLPLEDPRAYLHLIPWTDLSMVDLAFLQQSGVDLDVPFLQHDVITEWVLWTPPHPSFSWNHHLHTEDEVYEYNIVNDWAFPNHYLKDQVVFAVREVDQSDFISELRDYWNTWNDCALTQKTANGPLFLLETIPGLHFRGRKKHQDKVAALNYFRNLVEAHATNTLDTSLVRDIIGLGPGYTPLFEYSLRVIPEEQLFDISWDKPIGAGENGAVYAAMWRKPVGHLATMKSGNQELHIVLKDVLPRVGTSKDPLKKLLQELDVTYASLGGSAVGCVDFLGIALVHHWPKRMGSGKIPMLSSPEYGDRKLFLVFERATQGTVLGFMSRQLKDLTFTECWSEVADSLSSIANGINALHAHGVLHRDLHMNNILVTDRYYPNDPQNPHQYDYMITDIGEGKVLNPSQEVRDLTYHRASYGALEFRAPEIRGDQGWSTKAEVFSFGVIACKIMDCRSYICPSPTPEWVLLEVEREHPNLRQNADMIAHIVPAGLKRAIEPCLAHSPDDRPSMRDVIHALDDLTSDFTADRIEKGAKRKVKWIFWKWNESLKESRLEFSQTDGGRIGSNDFDEFSRAVIECFSTSEYEYVPMVTFRDIFDALQSGEVSQGLVPFENSTNGSVVFTLDLFADRSNLYLDISVCGEAYLDVHHYLLGHNSRRAILGDSLDSSRTTTPTPSIPRPPTPRTQLVTSLKRIERIYSHSQAFRQCEIFLGSYLKGIEWIDVSSTSKAAELVKADTSGTSAAIASRVAAEVHGLTVLAEGIGDREDNTTRFFILRKGLDSLEAEILLH